MHPQLELLLQIQDLKSQRRELADYDDNRQVEEQEFNIDIGEALKDLDERITELEQELPEKVRSRLEKFTRASGRAVVPVINDTCYGCFTAVPTASMSGLSRNDEVNHCESCGRFLYVVQTGR